MLKTSRPRSKTENFLKQLNVSQNNLNKSNESKNVAYSWVLLKKNFLWKAVFKLLFCLSLTSCVSQTKLIVFPDYSDNLRIGCFCCQANGDTTKRIVDLVNGMIRLRSLHLFVFVQGGPLKTSLVSR